MKIEAVLWFAFVISGIWSVLVLVIGYWYINYKY
jgi:hypothetical protein